MREPELVLGLMVVVVAPGVVADRLGALCATPLVFGGLALAFAPRVIEGGTGVGVRLSALPAADPVRPRRRNLLARRAANALRELYAHRQGQEPGSLDPADRTRDHAEAHRRLRQWVPGVERTAVVVQHDSGRIGDEAMHWVERNLDLAEERTGA